MLTDDAALDDVVRQDGGLLGALATGAIHMAMGTHGIDEMRALARAHGDAGQVLVAAPVLGRPDRAAAGELGIVPAGPAECLDRLRPLFEVIGQRCFEGGSEPESAAAIKIVLKNIAKAAGAPSDIIRVRSLRTQRSLYAKVLDANIVTVIYD